MPRPSDKKQSLWRVFQKQQCPDRALLTDGQGLREENNLRDGDGYLGGFYQFPFSLLQALHAAVCTKEAKRSTNQLSGFVATATQPALFGLSRFGIFLS